MTNCFVRLGEIDGHLRRRHRIAREGDHGRPLEQGRDGGGVGVLESDLARRFFATFTCAPRLLHLLAQSLHLGDGEAGIVSHHHDVRGLEDPAQFGDGLRFCRSIHCKLFPVWRFARVMREPPG